MSYFSTRRGSIIGAGRLSFRVRDGSGRFPAAVAAVTLFYLCVVLGVFGGGVGVPLCGFVVACAWRLVCVSYTRSAPVVVFCFPTFVGVCVSFRPVSASSLNPLLGV